MPLLTGGGDGGSGVLGRWLVVSESGDALGAILHNTDHPLHYTQSHRDNTTANTSNNTNNNSSNSSGAEESLDHHDHPPRHRRCPRQQPRQCGGRQQCDHRPEQGDAGPGVGQLLCHPEGRREIIIDDLMRH